MTDSRQARPDCRPTGDERGLALAVDPVARRAEAEIDGGARVFRRAALKLVRRRIAIDEGRLLRRRRQRLEEHRHRADIVVGQIRRAVVNDVEHGAERRPFLVVATLEERRDIVL